jgi:hypothetical protein
MELDGTSIAKENILSEEATWATCRRCRSLAATYDMSLLVITHLETFCPSTWRVLLVSVVTLGVNGPLRIESSTTLK